MNTISERLRFLIDTQAVLESDGDTSRRGEARTLSMLEKRTGITESRWRNLTRGIARANEETIEAACKLWPSYAIWLVTGAHVEDVENLSPLDVQDEPQQVDDLIFRRARTPGEPNEISIPHALKLRESDSVGRGASLTSHTMDWGYFGAGPCELAANVLYYFGVPAGKAKELRVQFAREVISNLDQNEARLSGATVLSWIRKNTCPN